MWTECRTGAERRPGSKKLRLGRIIIERLLIPSVGPSVGPPVNPGNVKEKRDERWNYERCAYARGDSARLASGDRIGRQPLGRRGGLSGQRHRRAGEDIGTATSCTRHRLNRNGDHDRLSHSGKAVQSRTGVHPEYRQTDSVHGLHECGPIPRSRAVSGELRSRCDSKRLEVRHSAAGHQSRRRSQSQVLAHGHPNRHRI